MRTPALPGRPARIAVAALALAVLPLSGAAADTITVEVHHSSFMVASPVPGEGSPHATINLGDTVRWVWMAGFHSVTSDDNIFDSGIHETPFTYEYTFNDPGLFPYYCAVHGGSGGIGMAGTVTVVPAPAGLGALGAAALLAARRRRR